MSEPESISARRSARAARSSDELTPVRDARWAATAHLGGIVGIIPSLAIFMSLGSRGPRTRIESKEALNWQLTFVAVLVVLDAVALILGGLVVLIATWAGHPAIYPSGLVLGAVSAVAWLPNIALSILGFARVRSGGSYRYPFAVRLLR